MAGKFKQNSTYFYYSFTSCIYIGLSTFILYGPTNLTLDLKKAVSYGITPKPIVSKLLTEYANNNNNFLFQFGVRPSYLKMNQHEKKMDSGNMCSFLKGTF